LSSNEGMAGDDDLLIEFIVVSLLICSIEFSLISDGSVVGDSIVKILGIVVIRDIGEVSSSFIVVPFPPFLCVRRL
jgi:hypothetical protein